MRISSNRMIGRYTAQLETSYEKQAKLMEQSDGSNLHRPSDDSIRYSKLIRYQNRNTENLQYQDNVTSAVSWMKMGDAAMVNMTDIYTTLKEKTVDAANETNGEDDLRAIAKEFKAKLYEIVSLGNTQQGDRYLFAGQSDTTQPFVVSVEEKDRGLPKTLDDPQTAYFTDPNPTTSSYLSKGVDASGTLKQMLTMKGSDGETYLLNTMTGYIYTEDFVMNGYKNKIASGQSYVTAGDEVGILPDWDPTQTAVQAKVSDHFLGTGEIIDDAASSPNAGKNYNPAIGANSNGSTITDSDGNPITLAFETISQHIVSYQGDARYISMVKLNGVVDQTADTVNATGQDLNGSDIFDDANSGNQTTIMSNGKVCYVSSGTAMINSMFAVCKKLEAADNRWMSSDGITIADVSHSTVNTAQTTTAARHNVYNSVATMLDKQNEIITGDINDVSGTDVGLLAIKLMEAQTIYNMSLSVGSRILPPSLADYL